MRRDLDVLRGVLILAVVGYHIGFNQMKYGFLGVDAFFVLSGYLISQKLLSYKASLKESVADFYSGRIRRLLPPFLVVSVVTLPVIAVVYERYLLVNVLQSYLAAASFLSNLYFFVKLDYFGGAAVIQPYLHTWSLAVEEQFYLLAPMVLYLLLKLGRSPLSCLVAILIVVTGLAARLYDGYDANAVFFLTPFRAYEILLGVYLALNNRTTNSRYFGASGNHVLQLILLGIFFAGGLGVSGLDFPRWLVLSLSVAWIAYGDRISLFKAGSLATTISYIGVRSYSWYLWHYPILAIAYYLHIQGANYSQAAAVWLALISFLLSDLTYRFVEQKIRKRRVRVKPILLAYFCVCFLVTIFLFNMKVFGDDNFDERANLENNFCLSQGNIDFSSILEKCWFNLSGEGAPTLVLWGDSHAAAIHEFAVAEAKRKQYNLMILTRAGCPPVFGVEVSVNTQNLDCEDFNTASLNWIKQNKLYKSVILASRWQLYLEGYNNSWGTAEYRSKPISISNQNSDQLIPETLGSSLRSTLMVLLEDDVNLLVLGPVPEHDFFVSAQQAQTFSFDRESFKEGSTRLARSEEWLRNSLVGLEVPILWPSEVMCTEYQCRSTIDGRLLYSDDDHVSDFGAGVLYQAYVKQ